MKPKPTMRRAMPVKKTGSVREVFRHRHGAHHADVDCPRRGEDQGDPVKEKGGGEGAEEEVLQRRLKGGRLPLKQPAKDVNRQGHQLKADEDRYKAVRRDHHHHAEGGEKQQRVILARRHLLPLSVTERYEGDEEEDQKEYSLEERAEGVDGVEAAEGARPHGPEVHGEIEGEGRPDEGEQPACPAPAGARGVRKEHEEPEDGNRYLRQDPFKIGNRRHHVHPITSIGCLRRGSSKRRPGALRSSSSSTRSSPSRSSGSPARTCPSS